MADVGKMFFQIKVDERDQDALRYLCRDLKSDESPRVYKLQRLAFGVNCIPFLAIATVQSHAKKCSEEFHDASREVLSSMYVGDCLSGADDVEATVKMQQSLDKMMERSGFNLSVTQGKSLATLQSKSRQSPVPLTSMQVSRSRHWVYLGIH